MFIAALFTRARTWKQPRCPSTDGWIKKLWYIHTREYYSAMKRNAFESVLLGWTNLEPTIQSEVSQKEKKPNNIYECIYMKSRRMALMDLFAGKQWRHRHIEQTYGQGLGAEEGEGEMNGESGMDAYTLPYVKQIANGNLLYDSGNSNWGSVTI